MFLGAHATEDNLIYSNGFYLKDSIQMTLLTHCFERYFSCKCSYFKEYNEKNVIILDNSDFSVYIFYNEKANNTFENNQHPPQP